jgi:SAM-dependent methyltransferase
MLARQALKSLLLPFPAVRRIFSQRDKAMREVAELRTENDRLRTHDDLIDRLALYGLDANDLTPPPPSVQPSTIDEAFRSHFQAVLERTFLAGTSDDYRRLPSYQSDLFDHIEGRYALFADHIVPWLKTVTGDMRGMTAIEIGSGTGASSLAFAGEVSRLICFEIDGSAVQAARERMAWFGHSHVNYVESPFGASCEFVQAGGKAHLIVLCAVLEHMTLTEVIEALRSAWDCLEPGGLLLVADTPNRFSPVDGHTSLLPLFSTLPRELKRHYAAFSPRQGFREAIAALAPEDVEMALTRWGSGISYHEFEVALGPDIHDHVVLDGYEAHIRAISGLTLGDATTRLLFDRFGVKAHRAFTRTNLYFVLRKPLVS